MPDQPTTSASLTELWPRIEQFQLDQPGASLTFTGRLARENGWSQAFASRVVEEYKRFVYLAMTAGHEVTPSDEVDQAWHLHLTYTRSYWEDLCGEVLGRPLHHGPTKGGQAEGERFEDQYERTLASYRAVFGNEPPSDIWPPASIRFGEAADFVRINRGHYLMFRKPRQPMVAMGLIGFSTLGIAPLAALDSAALVAIGLLALITIVVITATLGSGKRRGRKGRRGSAEGGGDSFGWSGCSNDSGSGGDSGCGASGCGGGCGGN